MKKLFAIVVIVAVLAGCNNESTTETNTQDSLRKVDSMRRVWIEDSSNAANKMSSDSANMKKIDSPENKMDPK